MSKDATFAPSSRDLVVGVKVMEDPMAALSSKQFSNWSGSACMSAREVVPASDITRLYGVLRQAREKNVCVRVKGAGHSFNAQVDCDRDGFSVRIDDFNELISVDKERGRVVVQAGMKLEHFYKTLNEHGLALPNVGIICEQTVAGAISTGTHGSGLHTASMSSSVIGIKVIDTTGSVRAIGALREDGDEKGDAGVLKGFQIGLGLLGIIVEVMFQCVPAYDLTHVPHVCSFKRAVTLNALVPLARTYSYFKAWWFPGTDALYMYLIDQPATRISPPTDLPALDLASLDEAGASEVVARNIQCLRAMTSSPHTNRWDYILTNGWEVSESASPVRFDACEYAVELSRGTALLAEMGAAVRSGLIELDCPVDIRFGGKEDCWLSISQGREVMYIGFCGKKPTAETPMSGKYRNTMAFLDVLFSKYQARPHWGKTMTASWTAGATVYPHFGKFRRLMKAMDPKGVLLNDFWRVALGSRL